MNFNGQARRSRPINLGNRKEVSRESTLKRAEQERLQRQQTRDKAAKAATIQKAWRNRHQSTKYARHIRDSYLNDPNYISETGIEFDFVLVLGILFEMSPHQLLNILANRAERQSPTLITAFKHVWEHRPIDLEAIDLSSNVLRKLQVSTLPRSSLLPVARLLADVAGHSEPVQDIFAALCKAYPVDSLRVLLQVPGLVKVVRVQALQPLFGLSVESQSGIDLKENLANALDLLCKLAPHVAQATPLLASLLVVAHGPLPEDQLDVLTPLYERQFVEGLMSSDISGSIETRALILQHLFILNPRHKTELLLHLTLARSPSLLQTFWTTFQKTDLYSSIWSLNYLKLELCGGWPLLAVALEMYSYWLVIANDSEMMNPERGLELEQFESLAKILRNLAFMVIWNQLVSPEIVAVKPIVLTTLRQVYTRDSRREFLPASFWLMQSHMDMERFLDVVDETAILDESDELNDDDEDDPFSPVNQRRGRRVSVSHISKRQEILRQTPFFVNFFTRAQLFYRFMHGDRQHALNSFEFGGEAPRHFQINREDLLEDAQQVFSFLGPKLKKDLRVQFVSNDMPEAGIDGGGLTKDLLTSVADQAFKQGGSDAYFITTSDHGLFPNPIYSSSGGQTEKVQEMYMFLGRVIAKCLYERILMDVEFAPFFLQKWAGTSAAKSSFDDLYHLDSELYSSMVQLYRYEGDAESLGLDFTVVGPRGQLVNLKHNGSDIPVTNANKLEYIHAVANYKLNVALGPQTRLFLHGMSDVINLAWLKMFNPHEIQTLISGGTADIDVDDLQRYTEISGFPAQSKTVANFWKALREMSKDEKGLLLKFVTSTAKRPLMGFQTLQPHFGIRCAATADDARLPTSSTCVNLLKLPDYSSYEILKEKLLYAIQSKAGFDLS